MQYHILIVSENATERSRYAETLIAMPPANDATYQITTVGSFAAAQLRATRQHFDLIIVALRQHDDGLELSSRLKELYPDMRLLLVCEQGVTRSQLKTARLIRASVAESTIDPDSLRAVVSDMLGVNILAPPSVETERVSTPPTRKQQQVSEPATTMILRLFLEELCRQANAQMALFATTKGNIIGKYGETTEIDTATVATIISEEFLHLPQLAQAIHETKPTQLCFFEGQHYDVYSVNVRENHFLSVFFKKEQSAPKLGFIWLLLKRSAEQLYQMK